MDNSTFNITNQLIQEQKSLWRIERHYLQEAQSEEEKMIWEELKKQKEETITKLSSLIK